jgi:acetyltransferase-like isoleucine patch superfamily enzyme
MIERFKNWEKPIIEEMKLTKYGWLVQHVKNLKLGDKTDIGAFTYINCKNGVEIEDNVQIGSHCSIYSFSSIDEKDEKVVLKENCKIGSHSTVMPGVTIGKNSVVGAHSFVKKSVPDNVLVFGVPAKIIKKLK